MLTAALRSRLLVAWSVALAIVCAALTVHPEHESDPFWHMSLARAVLAHGSRTVPEPLALPAFTNPAVVPEWLWGVLTLGAFRLGGWPALVAFTAVLAVLAAVLVHRLLGALRDDAGPGARMWISGLVMAIAMTRLRLRPESAGLVLLLAFLNMSVEYARAEKRRAWGLGLVALEILWAQLHGSFVLAPAVFFAVVAPAAYAERSDRPRARDHLLVALGLALGLATSAYGVHLGDYIAAHATGDASRHVADMQSPTWESLGVGERLRPWGPAIFTELFVGAAGALVARRVSFTSVTLGVLGLALGSNALRFLAITPVFLAPLALDGAVALGAMLSPRRGLAALGAAIGAVWLGLGAKVVHEGHGPLFTIGPAPGEHPEAAAAYLAKKADGERVLSVYNASGLLGYRLFGHGRVYVDGRTPLYFDATDFGVARDVSHDPVALARATRRFGATAIVVNRNARVCASPPAGWVPVVIEAHYTTFAPASTGAALTALAPCGESFLTKDACAHADELDAEIRRMADLGETPFVRFLRAARIVTCGGEGDAEALFPPRAQAEKYLHELDHLRAKGRLDKGDLLGAMDVAETALAEGDTSVAAFLAPYLVEAKVPTSRVRHLIEGAVARMDDGAPPELRAVLALTCAADDDAACVRFNAFRAAARGSVNAAPALMWLHLHDPSPRGRADADAWLDVLRTAPPASPPNGEDPDAGSREP